MSGETHKIIFGKIKKFFTDLKAVAFTGSYTDLSDTPEVDSVISNKSQNAVSNAAITYYLESTRDSLQTRIGANAKNIRTFKNAYMIQAGNRLIVGMVYLHGLQVMHLKSEELAKLWNWWEL